MQAKPVIVLYGGSILDWECCQQDVDAALQVVKESPELAERLLDLTFERFLAIQTPIVAQALTRDTTLHFEEVGVHTAVSSILEGLGRKTDALTHASYATKFQEGYLTKEFEVMALAHLRLGKCLNQAGDKDAVHLYELGAEYLIKVFQSDDMTPKMRISAGKIANQVMGSFKAVVERFNSYSNQLLQLQVNADFIGLGVFRSSLIDDELIPTRVTHQITCPSCSNIESVGAILEHWLEHYGALYSKWSAISRKANKDTLPCMGRLVPLEQDV